jgi:hypothetical protein
MAGSRIRLLVAVAALGLLAPTADATPLEQSERAAQRCIGYCTYPTNAAKVFKWGLSAWEDEFIDGTLASNWKSNQRSLVHEVDGMIAIDALTHTGNVVVWPDDQAARYGRWEARMSAVERAPRVGAKYKFFWELVPVGDSHCKGNDVVLASYRVDNARARGYVRKLPHNEFRFSKARDLQWGAWHTYAIEITKRRISWFVDTRVVRTERRTAALSGVKLRPQFRIVGQKGKAMRTSTLQFDWIRYYTLDRPNAKSIAAPRMRKATYRGAC